jgi:hypothetical protein
MGPSNTPTNKKTDSPDGWMKFKVQFEFSEFQLQQLVLYPNLF